MADEAPIDQGPALVLPPESLARIVAASPGKLKRKTVAPLGPKDEREKEFKALVKTGSPVYSGFPILSLVDGNGKSTDHEFTDK